MLRRGGGIGGGDDDFATIGRRFVFVPGVGGFEAFCNIALTPAAGLTFDIQVVEPPTNSLDTAVVLGTRFVLRF